MREHLAVVTGASSGIGLARAMELAERDHDLVLCAALNISSAVQFFDRADMQDTVVYGMNKDDPADVAREGIDALMAGDEHVIPGSVKNKLQAVTKGASEPVKAAMHARMTQRKA